MQTNTICFWSVKIQIQVWRDNLVAFRDGFKPRENIYQVSRDELKPGEIF